MIPEPKTLQIPLTKGMFAIIDAQDLELVSGCSWRAVKYKRSWYAKTDNYQNHPRLSRYMHRVIAQTPASLVTHHRNRNSLDNRRANLLNLTRDEHKFLHKNNSLIIKFNDRPSA